MAGLPVASGHCSCFTFHKANSQDAYHIAWMLFAKPKSIFRERNTLLIEMIICDLSIYTMDHPDSDISNILEYSICIQNG